MMVHVEVEKGDTLAIDGKKIAIKLSGKLINNRCVLPENMIKVMRENGIEVNPEDFPDSVERYKIEGP